MKHLEGVQYSDPETVLSGENVRVQNDEEDEDDGEDDGDWDD